MKVPDAIREEENKYNELCDELMNRIPTEEKNKVFSYPQCEYEYHFLGFLENYADLEDIIPKDFVVVDIGCYLALQAEYFSQHKQYIGLDPWISENDINQYCHTTNNSSFIHSTAKQFVNNFDEYAKQYNLDKEHMFVICSYVPAFNETDLIAETFPYVRVVYPGKTTIERLPEKKQTYKIETEKEMEL